MRRHVIIGRFGSLDRKEIPTAADEVATHLDLVTSETRFGYGIGHAFKDLKKLSIYPSEIGLDVLVLASLVHAADTRISRATESQDTWTREIRLVVPVSDRDRWSGTLPILNKMLNFLTGDRWTIGFRSRPEGFTSAVASRPELLIDPPFNSLSLFSGGLDSLIGAIDTLERGNTPLFISHAGEGATSRAQNACYKALEMHYNQRPINRMRAWISFPNNLVRGVGSEDTTRGRSFLFFALGVFAGTGIGHPFTLNVPENGFIALNVPLDPLRLGSHSTRTTHPFYMARWNKLLAALEIPCHIENPYWDKSKGEMVDLCANQALLRALISNSLSCSSPTKGRWNRRGIEQCGYCLPCLIRRAAIEKALGRGNDPTIYTIQDLRARTLNTRQSEGQQVRSFQMTIARMQSQPALAKLLIHKPGPLSDETAHLNDLADVYLRGVSEVKNLLAGVRTSPS